MTSQEDVLLMLLAELFPPGTPFDAINIYSINLAARPDLIDATGFLAPKVRRSGYGRGSLSKGSVNRIRRWLPTMVGREVAGARLCRDDAGWFYFVPIDPR
jgi:hypothetical protein